MNRMQPSDIGFRVPIVSTAFDLHALTADVTLNCFGEATRRLR
ncbi:predicted protein [Sclerotinia sclerotiorum 1980 UF-70]|uniref:Uncharacterized protein n=1 Tax=Sclerotinia sclerotiorum (strain ATCC 18683 / 1980 / Ss-1) TaxID=665079 RepID=A7EBF9_SCLS1|nr:predicted protein [Sclerotinia sclerotiorum 1980 UF-70]EDN99787.1 predicted protein [Sclerotinia sclerotiorum 1980 UF-70]